MSRLNRLAAVLAAMALVYPGICVAQPGKPAAGDTPQTVPEDTRPGKSGSTREPLGEKLDRTDGVIHPPPGVDPGLTLRPPPTGPASTPVIPPPGTPGGERGVEPK